MRVFHGPSGRALVREIAEERNPSEWEFVTAPVPDLNGVLDRTSFERLWESLGAGESPDLFVWQAPERHPVPEGIADCPVPTVAIVEVWRNDVEGLVRTARLFDWVAIDEEGARVLRSLGFERVLRNHTRPPSLSSPMESIERDVDVAIAPGLGHAWDAERGRWLDRALAECRPFVTRLLPERDADGRRKLLRRTKVLLHAVSRGEGDPVILEAVEAGTLVLTEESLPSLRHALRDGIECEVVILDGVRSVVERHLANREDRIAMASAARSLLESCDPLRDLIATLEPLSDGRTRRGERTLEKNEIAAERVAGFLRGHGTRERLLNLLPMGPWRSKIRTRLAEAKARIGEDASIDLERALAELEVGGRDDLSTRYQRAELTTRLGHRETARVNWRNLLEGLEKGHDRDLPSALMLRHTCEPAERAYARTLPGEVRERAAILTWRAWDALGDLALASRDRGGAVRAWRTACEARPSLAAWIEPKLGRLLVQMGEREEGLAGLRAALTVRPLEPSLWRAVTDMLFQARLLAECADLCEELLQRVELSPRLAPEGFWLRQRATECRVHFQQMRSHPGGFVELWV